MANKEYLFDNLDILNVLEKEMIMTNYEYLFDNFDILQVLDKEML